MPVYLDDKDARTETIKEHLQGVNCSVSEFMAYIYMDNNGLYIDDASVNYGELIDKIHAVHPTIELCDLVAEITDVMEVEEQEYFKGWMMHAKGLENLHKALRGVGVSNDFLDEQEEGCQTDYLSFNC